MNSDVITNNFHYLTDVLLLGGWTIRLLVLLLIAIAAEKIGKTIFR